MTNGTVRELRRNEYLCSPKGMYRFGMTSDESLCLCDGDDRKLWCAPDCCDEATFAVTHGPLSSALNGGVISNVAGDLFGTTWEPYAALNDDGCLVVHHDHTPRVPLGGAKTLWRATPFDPDLSPRRRDVVALRVSDDGEARLVNVCGDDDNYDADTYYWRADKESYVPYYPPTRTPTAGPSESLAPTTTAQPSQKPVVSDPPTKTVSLEAGMLVDRPDLGVRLSRGLTGRVISRVGENAVLPRPDAGHCFQKDNFNGSGGWTYVLGSSADDGGGGVGAFSFNTHGDLLDYRILRDNLRVGGGGATPWGTFLAGEYAPLDHDGNVWELDPAGDAPARPTQLGVGSFGSVACDDRKLLDRGDLACFSTADDRAYGALRRYRPSRRTLDDALRTDSYSDVLHKPGGTLDFLILDQPRRGSFEWINDEFLANWQAYDRFANAEGVDHHDGTLYFVSRRERKLFVLDLDDSTYQSYSTDTGPFDAGPDEMEYLVGDDVNDKDDHAYLYFAEDGGPAPGVFGRRADDNRYFTLLEKMPDDVHDNDRATGLAFCGDDHRRLMVAFRDAGLVLEITRQDGRPFHGTLSSTIHHRWTGGVADGSRWVRIATNADEANDAGRA